MAGAEWTAELPLRNGDWMGLSRPFDSTVHQSAMGPFWDTLRGTLIEKGQHRKGRERTRGRGVAISSAAGGTPGQSVLVDGRRGLGLAGGLA